VCLGVGFCVIVGGCVWEVLFWALLLCSGSQNVGLGLFQVVLGCVLGGGRFGFGRGVLVVGQGLEVACLGVSLVCFGMGGRGGGRVVGVLLGEVNVLNGSHINSRCGIEILRGGQRRLLRGSFNSIECRGAWKKKLVKVLLRKYDEVRCG